MEDNRRRMWPTNFPAGNQGYINLPAAMAVSKNTAAVQILDKLSPKYSFDFMYNELNMHSLVERMVQPSGKVLSDIDIAPLALGGMTTGVTVYEITAAYMVFANKGIYSTPRSYTEVKDSGGNTILNNRLEQKTVISEETAFIMTKLLEQVIIGAGGTGRGLQMRGKVDVAGKTGTTNDDCDRWFIGYTPYFLCGAWFGYDQPRYLGVNRGAGNPPLMLFHYVMDTIHGELYDLYGDPKSFEKPPGIIEALYCWDSGMAPGPNCALDPRGSSRRSMGYFERGSEPAEPCNGHVRVDWCTITGAVAGPGCPRESIREIALVRNDGREWPQNPHVADAQYTYRDVGENYVYPANANRPFYQNLLEEGRFSGTSGGGRPVNSFCVEHNPTLTWAIEHRPRPTEPPATTAERTTDPPAETTTGEIETTTDPENIQPTIDEPATPEPTTAEPEPSTEPASPEEEPEPTIGNDAPGDNYDEQGNNNNEGNMDIIGE